MTARVESVDVGILNWNGLAHLRECLPALQAQRDPGVAWRTVVFDNGSTDGSLEWLEQQDVAGLEVVRSSDNLGFCGGYNALIRGSDADAVVLLNNDTRPEVEWLARLVDALRRAPADVAAVSGLIVDWAGERLDFARGVMTFDGHAFQADYHRPLGEVTLPADGSELLFACGGNMIVRRESFLQAGGFDEDYFAYLEDVDLGWRLWSGGERVTLATDAVVRHRSMATSDLLGVYNRGFLFERNAFLTASKNYDAELWPQIMPSILLTLVSRTQTLMVQNNPRGDLLTVDPYARPEEKAPVTHPEPAAAARRPGRSAGHWMRRFRELGPRAALRKVVDRLLPAEGAEHPTLSDPRTVAQLRAVTYVLGHLDAAAARRAEVQARRSRPDREIFERFPLHLVPTYPGDERLFSSEAFDAWTPGGLELVRTSLQELMGS